MLFSILNITYEFSIIRTGLHVYDSVLNKKGTLV
jgi:hypothetical protein